MNVVGINFDSVVDGDGVRVTVFVAGCKHFCGGCHNPASHSFSAGQLFTQALQDEIIAYVKHTPFVSGVTLSGGDPMFSAAALIPFVSRVRRCVPQKNIWIYTGFTFEQILQDETMTSLLSLCDVLVDGKFVQSLADPTLYFRGSTNQRIICVRESLETRTPVLWRGAL